MLFAACGDNAKDSNPADDRIKVVTTLPLFADFVRQIGGHRVEVFSLVPAGADPHTFQASPSDVQRISEADIAFSNGLGLEPGLIQLIQANLADSAPFVKLGEFAQSSGISESDIPEEMIVIDGNPHLWLRPSAARVYSIQISVHLREIDAVGFEDYAKGDAGFQVELNDLIAYLHDKLDAIPAERRKLVTTHDAFVYFARAWDFEVAATLVPGPEQEPTPDDLARIIRAIRDEGVPAVFGEPQVEEEGRILQQAAEDAGVEFCTLYSDSLDDRVTNYIELMRFNADELARCLGGP